MRLVEGLSFRSNPSLSLSSCFWATLQTHSKAIAHGQVAFSSLHHLD